MSKMEAGSFSLNMGFGSKLCGLPNHQLLKVAIISIKERTTFKEVKFVCPYVPPTTGAYATKKYVVLISMRTPRVSCNVLLSKVEHRELSTPQQSANSTINRGKCGGPTEDYGLCNF